MDLYDDIDTKPRNSQIDGWSSGIKMLQTQLAVKKAAQPAHKKPLMTPVINMRAKHSEQLQHHNNKATLYGRHESSGSNAIILTPKPIIKAKPLSPVLQAKQTDYWHFENEYDPHWPNEYEKLKEKIKEKDKSSSSRDERSSNNSRKSRRGGSAEHGSSNERKHARGRNSMIAARRDSNSPPMAKFSGFAQRRNSIDEERFSPPAAAGKSGGVAIAPPASLQEISIANENGDGSSNVTIPYTANSVAAKIMAKYGFKDGQGLGKQEQGMSMALQVEKTSKRGGRIIHEKDVLIPTQSYSPPPSTAAAASTIMPPPAAPAPATSSASAAQAEPSITEIMKDPSKVVLLRNMVGPGDVDEELEPEVKDECNTKYGEVIKVVIHESFGTTPEDAVKIFVEFKRIESAIKAVVDLNGRFFGGRQVRAGFYNYDKFKTFQLH